MNFLDIYNNESFTNIDSICLGHFDGMHKAHQEIISKLSKNGAILCIGAENSLLTPNDYRKNFTSFPIFALYLRDVKSLSAQIFFEHFFKIFPNVQHIVIGYDFIMGKNKSCSYECIKEILPNIKITIINEVTINNQPIHTTIIKQLIQDGQIQQANLLLDRKYSIKAKTIKGQGIGKKELFATINVENNLNFLLPKDGVYKTNIQLSNKKLKSITFLGKRLSTDNNFSIETHILENIENMQISENVEIFFIEKIRDNIFFKTKEELKKQIQKDILIANIY